jgi:UDP-N-acetylmuramoylalanine--D-glutamate ligase
MRVAILGYAGQGQSSHQYWEALGHDITICDRDTSIKPDGKAHLQLGADYLHNLDQFDILVRTPALHPRDIIAANSPEILSKVTSNTNEFLRVCPTKNIIGVTGTKGKGTTSTLIAHILKTAGKTVHLGGNIGTPPLDLLNENIQQDDWVVLELANFQLIDMKLSPHIAVCLMVVPEHLDWHEDMEEYIAAKQQLFINQTENDTAIYYANNRNSESIADASSGNLIPYMKEPGALVKDNTVAINSTTVCNISDIKLLGEHNWQNVCAAVTAAWQVTKNVTAIKTSIQNFSGLPHRIELVRELNGIKYYNDSFGTTPETAMVATKAFSSPKILILGGSDKGADFDELAKTVTDNNVKGVIIIGQTGSKIKKALFDSGFNGFIDTAKNMDEIVNKANSHAQMGDIVLLSTACASFGMFKNYEDRGNQFKQTVLGLSLAA